MLGRRGCLKGAIKGFKRRITRWVEFEFQYLKGAIKRDMDETDVLANIEFQYLKGAIKSGPDALGVGVGVLFQYLKGAIKSAQLHAGEDRERHFNTSKVRLKVNRDLIATAQEQISIPQRCD